MNIKSPLHYLANISSLRAPHVTHLRDNHGRNTDPVPPGDYCPNRRYVLLQSALELACLLGKGVYFFPGKMSKIFSYSSVYCRDVIVGMIFQIINSGDNKRR